MTIGLESLCILINVLCVGQDVLARVMAVINQNTKQWILHNAKFDIQFFFQLGYCIKANIFDTLLAETVLLQGRARKRVSLALVVRKYAGVTLDKSEQISNWAGRLTNEQLTYAALDVVYLRTIMRKQLQLAEEKNLLSVIEIENKVVKATAGLEFWGSCVDTAKLDVLMKQAEEKLQEIEGEFADTYGEDINIKSSSDILEILEWEGIRVKSSQRKVLMKYADNPVVERILEYRDVQKRYQALKGIGRYVEHTTGKIFSSYGQNFTSTGRYISSKPNLQGIPKDEKIRSLFIAPKGKSLVICDYSQMELRLMAEIADDPEMIKAYQDGKDLHTTTAADINHITYGEVTSKQRSAAKAMNFGLIYGMSTRTFITYARVNYGVEFGRDEALEAVGAFKQKYSKVAERIDHMMWKDENFEKSLSGRTRVWYKEPPTMNQRCNYAIQATGADIIKDALYETERQLIKPGVTEFYGCIHDEIILVTDEAIAEDVAKKLKNIMEQSGKKYMQKVPLTADVSVGKNRAAK